MTAMKAAFEKAGVSRDEMEFYAACYRAIRAIGFDRALKTLRLAQNELSSDQKMKAPVRGHVRAAPARHPDEAADGHDIGAAVGKTHRASAASPHRGEDGPYGNADLATLSMPPLREPSVAQRRTGAAVARTLALTVLDTIKVRDGRAIGDVRFGEIERMRTANVHEAALLRLVQKHARADDNARIRDVVKADELQRMMQKAAEVADAA